MIASEGSIRIIRERRGLTLEELSERAGVERGFLSPLENRRRTPSFDTLRRLAQVLGVDLDDLAD